MRRQWRLPVDVFCRIWFQAPKRDQDSHLNEWETMGHPPVIATDFSLQFARPRGRYCFLAWHRFSCRRGHFVQAAHVFNPRTSCRFVIFVRNLWFALLFHGFSKSKTGFLRTIVFVPPFIANTGRRGESCTSILLFVCRMV